VKSTVRKSIRLGLVAGLAVTGLVGVTSLTASGTGMDGYGTLRIDFDTSSTPSTGLVTYTPASSGEPVLTQPIVTRQPCNTIAFGPISNGTGKNLLDVTPQAVNNQGVASNAGSVQLTKIGAGVQISGTDCGDPSGQIGPGEQLTLALGDYFDPEVVAKSAALQIGKRQANDGSLTIAFDAAANGATRTEVSIATGGQRVTVTDGNGDFRIISLRSTARQQSRGLSLLSTTEINLEAPAELTAPGAPTDVTAKRGNGQAEVSWTAPADTGGSDISGYELQYSSNNGTTWIPDPPLTATSGEPVTGLNNGTAYIFRVRAVNDVGPGAWSLPPYPSATPATVPDAPTDVTAKRGNGQAEVSWTAPADTGGSDISGYELQYSSNNGTTWIPDPPLTATSGEPVTGLNNGTAYIFRVRAVNDVGPGAWSLPPYPSATPATVPDAPTEVTAKRGNGQAEVSWTAPADGGSLITSYKVQYSADGGTTWAPGPLDPPITATASPTDVPGLTNGTPYMFRVRAVNDVGPGAWSLPPYPSATPATVPDAPTEVTAASNNPNEATVTWIAPDEDGGSDITRYKLEYRPTGSTAWIDFPTTALSSETVTGLSNGTEYIFRVAAVNAVGTGPFTESNPVTPWTQLVDCGEEVVATDGGEPKIAERAAFLRGENGAKTVECVDVGVVVEIVGNDWVYWDNSSVGVDGTAQAVQGTVTILWAPIPVAFADVPTQIDYDGPGTDAGFTDRLWCKSFSIVRDETDETTGKRIVEFDAELPTFNGDGNVNGKAPWCLVSSSQSLDGNGNVIRVETFFGAGDPLTKTKLS
jgi:predicted phage tail protein